MLTGMTVQINMTLPIQVKHEGDWFVSRCPILDVYSQGRTREQALANINEALRLFVESCFERGTLVQVLQDCGFRVRQGVQGRQAWMDDPEYGGEYLTVPIPLIVQQQQEECHA